MTEAVIVGGSRTPLGRMSGALGSLSAVDLGAEAIAGALDRACLLYTSPSPRDRG